MKKYIYDVFTLFKIIFVLLLIISCGEETTKPNQPPIVSITSGPSGTITTNQATFSWSGSDSDGSISGYYYDLDDSTPDTWTSSTTKTFYSLSNGSHTFYVKAKDNDGDYSVIASRSFVVVLPIIVTEPSSSTLWKMGQQNVSITWDTGNLGGDVDIRLYKGSTYDVIAYTTVNDGSFNYNVPTTLEAGSNYRVRVYYDASHYDYSDYFTINQTIGNITVTEPINSTVWTTGQQNVSITWDTGNLGGSVDISLYKGSSLVETIITSISNNGSFNSYDVTNTLTTGSDYRIRVYYDASHYDYSEYFTINEDTTNIVVTVPTGSTVWTMGDENVTISWDTGNLGGTVNIRLYQESTYVDEITSSTNNGGSYNSYDVPTTLSAGSNYRVRVYYDASHYDYSDYFTIIGIEVPNLNEIVEIDITDDNMATNTFCNHDGQVNVTEDISLEVKVKNNGNATAYNITGEISLPTSDLNCCDIDDPFTSFPNISSGSSEWSINDFDFWVYCMPSDEDLDFTLTLNYEDENGTQYESQIDFDIDVGDEPIPIIDSATLQLTLHYSSGVGSYSDLELRANTSYFNESGNCGTIGSYSYGETGYGTGSTAYWNANDIVENWFLSGENNYGFQVYPQYNGNDYLFKFYTSESSSTNYPKLTINYHWEGQSGQFIEDTANMDITFWYCNGSNYGCDIIPPDYYLMNAGRSSGSMCPGGETYLEIPKVYFDINESNF